MRALDSTRLQSFKDIKIIIRDNCSTDRTESVVLNVASIDNRVCYVKQTSNIGPHENIRQGIKSVDTDFFSFLCDDDYLEPDFYNEAMRLFGLYPKAGFIAFRVDIVDLNGNVLHSNMENFDGTIKSLFYNSEDGIDAYLKGLLPYTLTGYVFKKEVADFIDFGEFSEVGYGADIFFIWHAASRFDFVVTNFKGGNYCSHAGTTSSTLVNCFDERFLYWWRNRMQIIINDSLVSNEIKEKITKYCLSHSTKSFHNFKYYLRAAALLMIDRVKKRQFDELKFDFIAMRSFISFPILFSIKLMVLLLVHFKLDNKLRSIITIVNRLCKLKGKAKGIKNY
jgi:glycosyltransferase involved in cell wall biosynthesis